MIVIIANIIETKSPTDRRPAAASCPAINNSAARPTAPISCTMAEEMLRVASTFIASFRLVSASAP